MPIRGEMVDPLGDGMMLRCSTENLINSQYLGVVSIPGGANMRRLCITILLVKINNTGINKINEFYILCDDEANKK